MAMAQAKVFAKHCEPASAPHPVAKNRIDDRCYKPAIDEERKVFPPLCHSTRRNRGGGIHKHHLKEKKCEDRNVVGRSGKKKPFGSEKPELFSKQVDDHLMVEARIPAHGCDWAQTSEHEGKPADIESEHTKGVDHEIHCHCMSDIFSPGKPCLHHGESGLHEHDEKPGNQCPYHIDCHPVMANGIDQFPHGGFAGFGSRDVRGIACRGATRIWLARWRRETPARSRCCFLGLDNHGRVKIATMNPNDEHPADFFCMSDYLLILIVP